LRVSLPPSLPPSLTVIIARVAGESSSNKCRPVEAVPARRARRERRVERRERREGGVGSCFKKRKGGRKG